MKTESIERRKELIIEFINSKDYRPMKIADIAYILQVSLSERHVFTDVISELEKNGEIMITKHGKIMGVSSLNIIKGSFTSNARGFGFVTPDDNVGGDIFIEPDYVHGAMNKDTVLCRIIQPEGTGRRAEGEIVKIIKRGLNSIVGTFQRGKNHSFVIPDDKKLPTDIYISKNNALNAVTGHKVVVKIIKPADAPDKNPEGKVIEVLGHKNEPGVDILSIIRQFDLPLGFNERVSAQAATVKQEISEDECENRLDLRQITTVTIDNDDALDLDDAISIERIPYGYKLGVHIADVVHYVDEGSPLDKEALKRGTSVYLADRVIPMLPFELSNGICSLNSGVDRLSLSCIMDIDLEGNVIKHKIAESIIHVDKRCSYTGVSLALEDDNTSEEYAPFLEMLKTMAELRDILKNKRLKRGSIEFEFPETKIILDSEGNPLEIMPRETNIASSIIEEFMLVCNETVAEEYHWLEAPFVYRSHEEPDSEKIENLAQFVRHFGYTMRGKSSHPKRIQALISDISGKPEEMIISKAALRSMKQARYTPKNFGHFGLAAKYYCHFTSPIRRYPDLQIHRIIKDNLNGRLSNKQEHYAKLLPEVAKNSSVTERNAEEAEREVDKLKKVQFMSDKEGQEFEAIISYITSFGVFVELPNTVDGLISLSHMEDDYYIYHEKSMELVGEKLGKVYKLGQHVRVRLTNADLDNRRLDFAFCYE